MSRRSISKGFVAAFSRHLPGERVIGRVHHVDIATQGRPPKDPARLTRVEQYVDVRDAELFRKEQRESHCVHGSQ